MSSSAWSGSSGKKRGSAPRPAIAKTDSSTRTNRSRAWCPAAAEPSLEDMTEPPDEMGATAAAECAFDAKEHAVARAEPEADPVVRFEIAEGQILDPRRHLAGVVEDRAVDGREDLPA